MLKRQSSDTVHNWKDSTLFDIQLAFIFEVTEKRQRRIKFDSSTSKVREEDIIIAQVTQEPVARNLKQSHVTGNGLSINSDRQIHLILTIITQRPILQLLRPVINRILPSWIRHHDISRA